MAPLTCVTALCINGALNFLPFALCILNGQDKEAKDHAHKRAPAHGHTAFKHAKLSKRGMVISFFTSLSLTRLCMVAGVAKVSENRARIRRRLGFTRLKRE
ncbi:hypothetical protein TRVL_04814 [Trypanosoma vivax]|nr:hypothetical protein TRVL_04814 [Trypanosoma vivax]